MKHEAAFFATALLVVSTSGAAAASKTVDCRSAQQQIDLDICADRDFRAADAQLNALYRSIQANYNSQGRELLTSERAWIAYRDSECAFETDGVRDGSAQPMMRSMCLGGMTRLRIRELEQQRDCADGDLSCNAGDRRR